MRKVSIVVAAALMASASFAADLPSRRAAPLPPILVPLTTWTGFYAGGNVGAILNDSREVLAPSGSFLNPAISQFNSLRTFAFRDTRTSVTGGAQIGYNYEVGPGPGLVIGAEADINYGIRSSRSFDIALTPPLSGTAAGGLNGSVDYFGTVRGRLGYAFDRILVFGTGGFAYGETRTAENFAFSVGGDTYAGSRSKLDPGYAVGGGLEFKVTPNLSLKAEYLRVDLASLRSTSTPAPGFGNDTYDTRFRPQFNVARAGFNYFFVAPVAPVVARY